LPLAFWQYANDRQTKAVKQDHQDDADRQPEPQTPRETMGKFINVPSAE
jgi:hypothetical protein